MKRTYVAVAAALSFLEFLFFPAAFLGAQETQPSPGIETDLDALFGEEVVESEKTAPAASDPLGAALKTEKVRIGGSFSASLGVSASWTELWSGASDPLDPEEKALNANLGATLFFDARPEEDFRVYGSAKTAWPFYRLAAGAAPATASVQVPSLSIFELFADLSLSDKVFLRLGKSTVKWGVGYFWSPADVISLSPIDPFDAQAQREGPVNLRVHIPVLGTQNNFYLYTILDKDSPDFATTALAGKAEFLLGRYELGLGLYYRYDTAERATLTLTGPLGDFDVFGEAAFSRGSAKRFVSSFSSGLPYVSFVPSDETRGELYASASAGFLYSSAKDNFTAVAQYFYNGEGYAPADRERLIAQAKTALAANPGPAPEALIKAALMGLMGGSGRHYAAVSLSQGQFLAKDLSASLTLIANCADWSGLVKPGLSWRLADHLSLALSSLFVFGPEDSEYLALAGGNNLVSLSLGATLSGSF